jgi:hypothetical protein
VTTSFQKDSNSFKLQGATFDKWIFPQKETGQRTKPSLLSYVKHFKLLLIKVKLFKIDGFVRSRHPVEPARGLPASGGRASNGVQTFFNSSETLDSGPFDKLRVPSLSRDLRRNDA